MRKSGVSGAEWRKRKKEEALAQEQAQAQFQNFEKDRLAKEQALRPKRYRLNGKQDPPKPFLDPGRSRDCGIIYLQSKGTETEPELLGLSGLLWDAAMAERMQRVAREANEMKQAADKQREDVKKRRRDA